MRSLRANLSTRAGSKRFSSVRGPAWPRRWGARLAPVMTVLALAWPTHPVTAQATYWAYVANESSDIVSLVRFDGRDVVEEKAIDVGFHPADLDGAHGIRVSPTGRHWYVSIAHGQPYGQVWKMETGTDQFVDSALVGLFPATMATTPDGASLFVVNFNLHGDPVPSSVSAVFTPIMSQVGQIETCVMPHGSRVSSDGARHYSTCMMSDQLVETSIADFRVSRRLELTVPTGSADVCKPTWVVLSPDDSRIYVPCNGRGDVLEIDAKSFEILRRFAVGGAPYNADVTPDGATLVVTRKGASSVAIVDLATGEQKVVATSQSVTHGVAVTPDGRYAFVSNEAVGATRGTIDVIDLASAELAASSPLHYQPGGLDVWKMEPAGSGRARPDRRPSVRPPSSSLGVRASSAGQAVADRPELRLLPPQLQPSGPAALCQKHRWLAIGGAGLAAGGLTYVVLKGLEDVLGSDPDTPAWQPAAVVGAGGAAFAAVWCALKT